MTMKHGERQVAPTLEGIRADHVARYQFAAQLLKKPTRVIDFACGVGYGSKILADAGHFVYGYDRDPEAIAYARQHYHATGKTRFRKADAAKLKPASSGFDVSCGAAICFETIEHVEDPRPLLRALRGGAPMLIASVPNEAVFPYTGQLYHFRHYTLAQFEQLLGECGWQVTAWHGQEGPESPVEPGLTGRTLVAVAKRCKARKPAPTAPVQTSAPAPLHVAILGLGPSLEQYSSIAKRAGGRRAYCDETWGINALGDVYACDLVFHMDDVRVQEIRAAAAPTSNIAAMVRWLRGYGGRVITSVPKPKAQGYPGLEFFPLEEIVNRWPQGYFNSTAAYAIAYAIHIGVKKLSLFGMDFTYPKAHDAEKGRACVEFWLGIAVAHGIELAMPKTTSLMDACGAFADRFYGYDGVDLAISRRDGRIAVDMTDRAALPTAEEIEARYDHTVHPNPLVSEGPEA